MSDVVQRGEKVVVKVLSMTGSKISLSIKVKQNTLNLLYMYTVSQIFKGTSFSKLRRGNC